MLVNTYVTFFSPVSIDARNTRHVEPIDETAGRTWSAAPTVAGAVAEFGLGHEEIPLGVRPGQSGGRRPVASSFGMTPQRGQHLGARPERVRVALQPAEPDHLVQIGQPLLGAEKLRHRDAATERDRRGRLYPEQRAVQLDDASPVGLLP